jgi:hypothetical protein
MLHKSWKLAIYSKCHRLLSKDVALLHSNAHSHADDTEPDVLHHPLNAFQISPFWAAEGSIIR